MRRTPEKRTPRKTKKREEIGKTKKRARKLVMRQGEKRERGWYFSFFGIEEERVGGGEEENDGGEEGEGKGEEEGEGEKVELL